MSKELREAAQQALQWIRRGNPDLAHEVLFEALAQPDAEAPLVMPGNDEACEHFISSCDSAGIQYDGQSYEAGFMRGKSVGMDEADAQPDDKAQPVMLEHVAVAEDGGKLRWLTARRPRDCELYAMPDGGRAPSKLYAAPQPPVEQPEPEWIDDPHDIEQGMMRNPKWKPAERGAELSDVQSQSFYDLAWRHGALASNSFAGDELEAITFAPVEFDAFCLALLAADRAARGGAS